MFCLICGNLSFSHICKNCRKEFLQPSLNKRVVENDFEVFSFYKYNSIKNLILTKHKFIGFFIYHILAQESFQKFAKEFKFTNQIYSFACDDHIKSGYSHTAILNKYLKSSYITPVHSALRAQNQVNYSGKSLQFRESNPRNFKYSYMPDVDAIIVDDIITTGTTIKEAKKVLEIKGVNVLFALTLADARE